MNVNRYFGYRSFEPEYETMKEMPDTVFPVCACISAIRSSIPPTGVSRFPPGYPERQERRISLMSNGASQICSVRHTLHLPEKRKMPPLFAERAPIVSDCVELNLRRGQFAAFRLDQPDEASKRFSDKITNHLYRR